jgi:ATP-dependent protease Clp ATPase subunit
MAPLKRLPTPIICAFCEGTLGEARRGMHGNLAAICSECVELCLSVIKTDDEDAFEGIVRRARDFKLPDPPA